MSRLLLIILLLLPTTTASAGVLATGALKWQTLALRPLTDEPTPNYFGYGGELQFGYSFARKWDLALYTSYTPMRMKSATFGTNDLVTFDYGIATGFRIASTVYLGLRGGWLQYDLNKKFKDEEIDGTWRGFCGFFELGTFWPVSKPASLQVALLLGHGGLERIDSDDEKRFIDTFGVTMTYVYNKVDGIKFGNSFISDFVDSLIF